MSRHLPWRKATAVLGGAALTAAALSGCSGGSSSGPGSDATLGGPVTISFLGAGSDPITTDSLKDLVTAFEKANPNITVKLNGRPGGTDGDNVIKTRMATNDMDDVFYYNSGSQLQGVRPDKTLVDLSTEPWAKGLSTDFKSAAGAGSAVWGAPWGTTFAGGVLYNKKVYSKLGLSVPTTWAQFLANSKKIKAAGITPVLQSYGDTWTSQLLVLADFANVSAATPDWASKFTANKEKFVNPPALAGFQHTEDLHTNGLLNKDFQSLTNVDALKDLATGKGAQYPMLSVIIGNVLQNNPDQVNDIGFFATPADDEANTRMTVWEPSALYIPKSTTGDKLIAAKKFVAFAASSKEACAIQNDKLLPSGPYATTACEVGSSAPALVQDEQKYVDAKKTGLALEFVSPVKGPNLEKILVQVGTGVTKAKAAAALYDDDVKKQAQQLGLDGWN